MEKTKKNKTFNALAITVFTVIRVVMFSYFPNVSDKSPYIVLGVLLATYAVLTSVLFMRVSNKCENKADMVLLFMFADFFFTMQSNSAILIVSILWEVCALLTLSEKKTPIKETVLFVVSFASAIVKPYTAFSYVLLGTFVYFMKTRKNSPVKATVCALIAAACGVSGFAVNSLLLKDNTEFVNFVNQYTLSGYDGSVVPSIAVVIPVAAIAALLLGMMVNFSKADKKSSRPADAKEAGHEMIICVIGSAVMFGVSLVGFALNQVDMYMLVNQIVPSVLIVMLLNRNNAVEKTFKRVNSFASNHPFAAISIFIAVFGIQIYCLDAIGLGGEIRSFIERQVY